MKNGETVYSLASWTIREQSGKYYIAKTAHWTGKHIWSHSYKSLSSACTAIARHLEREWTDRLTRQQRFDKRMKRWAA